MTLKELSDELGREAHVLANKLRRVGLADRLLCDDDQLNIKQETHLRQSKLGDNYTSLNSLSLFLNLPVLRIRKIIERRGVIAPEDPNTLFNCDFIEDIEASALGDKKSTNKPQLFFDHYIKEHSKLWQHTVIDNSNDTKYFQPGKCYIGKITGFDYLTDKIIIEFDEISHNEGMIFKNKIIDYPSGKGTISLLSEWSWAIFNPRQYPKCEIGMSVRCKVLQNHGLNNLVLSRRMVIDPPSTFETGLVKIVKFDLNLGIIVQNKSGLSGYITGISNEKYKHISSHLNTGHDIKVKSLHNFRINGTNPNSFFSEFELVDDKSPRGPRNNFNLRSGLESITLFNEKTSSSIAIIKEWADLERAYIDELYFVAKVIGTNSGGFLLRIPNTQFDLFCPASEAPEFIKRDLWDMFIEEQWICHISKCPDPNSNTVVSAKYCRDFLKTLVNPNSYWEAIILNCSKSGATLLLDSAIPCFLPNRYIAWHGRKTAIADLNEGQRYVVAVRDINEKGIYVSMRDAVLDPWLQVERRNPVGQVTIAKLEVKEEKYIILSIDDTYDAFLPASEISWTEYIEDCRKIEIDNNPQVIVVGYDNNESRKVIVSLKQLTIDPWSHINDLIPADKIVDDATVVKITPYNAELLVGRERLKGYLSFRDINWLTKITKETFPYEIGETIRVKIISINVNKRYLDCSIKAMSNNPWEALKGLDFVNGKVIGITPQFGSIKATTDVELFNGIKCVCPEKLDENLLGKTLEFEVLNLDINLQCISISLHKQYLSKLNSDALDSMFQDFTELSENDKETTLLSRNDEPYICGLRIKSISTTGRIITEGDAAGNFDRGIMLPTSVTLNGNPVNIIFARGIIREYLVVGKEYNFKVSDYYNSYPYAVLSLDANQLIDIENINLSDLEQIQPGKHVNASILWKISTSRTLFVYWHGYIGYVDRREFSDIITDDIKTLTLTATHAVTSPEQLIRFIPVHDNNTENEKVEDRYLHDEDVYKKLPNPLRDCYDYIMTLVDVIDCKNPSLYLGLIQLRYNATKFPQLQNILVNNGGVLSANAFHLYAYETKNENATLCLANDEYAIYAIAKRLGSQDEFVVYKFLERNKEPEVVTFKSRPLKIRGKNVSVVELESSVEIPVGQSVDRIIQLINYNNQVLPELRKLSQNFLAERGEDYLELMELLKREKAREESLAGVAHIPAAKYQQHHSNEDTLTIEFQADEEDFTDIISPDDSENGTNILVKPNDGKPFPKSRIKSDGTIRAARLTRKGKSMMLSFYNTIELSKAIEQYESEGLMIKRNPNVKHLKRQIIAIDNFVYEKGNVEIFGKISRQQLRMPESINGEFSIYNENLRNSRPDSSQLNALRKVLGNADIALIQGPPGTGKSTVIVEAVKHLVENGEKVLVCTQSIAPVEELYDKLKGQTINEVPLRCTYLRDNNSIETSCSTGALIDLLKTNALLVKDLKKFFKNNPDGNPMDSSEIEKRISSLKNESDRHFLRDLSRLFNSIPAEAISGIEGILTEYINELNSCESTIENDNNKIIQLGAVDVVFGTCIGIGVSPLTEDLMFDTLILDEAGKANYAETIVPMLKAEKYILVGDEKQLPPFTNHALIKDMARERVKKSVEDIDLNEYKEALRREEEAILCSVGKSLFADLREQIPQECQTMLDEQFRMHPAIGDFISKLFYEEKVKTPTLKAKDRTINIEKLEHPIMFYDTSCLGIAAREEMDGTSLYNEGEIDVIEEVLIPMLKEAKRQGKTISFLSPYGAQVRHMTERFKKYGFDYRYVHTIDSIQGSEYDIVVFSFVRNIQPGNSGNLNFIDDLKRLNVSFSRARCNLIMVGHLNTLINKELHTRDSQQVEAVYDEIMQNKVTRIALPGPIELLKKAFPPVTCPYIDTISSNYYIFENCQRGERPGEFLVYYKGKRMVLYNPKINTVQEFKNFKEFPMRFIGYDGEKIMSGLPLSIELKTTTRPFFEFEATVSGHDNGICRLSLADKTEIELQIPITLPLSLSKRVIVAVRSTKVQKYFTIKPVENE